MNPKPNGPDRADTVRGVTDGPARGDHVFADERQARIAEHVSVRGRARIGELAEIFGVTEPTIRKDLSALQEQGLLKRTHGGALAIHPNADRELTGRQTANPTAKEAIARACLGLLRDGDSVFLDSGTTVEALARALAEDTRGLRLSVLTSSLGVALSLADVREIDCVLLVPLPCCRDARAQRVGEPRSPDHVRFLRDCIAAVIAVGGALERGLAETPVRPRTFAVRQRETPVEQHRDDVLRKDVGGR